MHISTSSAMILLRNIIQHIIERACLTSVQVSETHDTERIEISALLGEFLMLNCIFYVIERSVSGFPVCVSFLWETLGE